ncbi:MAG: hypothetical protein AAGE52_39695 [Myxococcota bacterium]
MATNDLLVDKRIVQRNIAKGNITREEYAKHLEGLKDVEDNAELISIEDTDAPAEGAEGAEAAEATEAKSYYKEIDGKKYDAGIIEAAEKAVAGRGDGRISLEDAATILKQVKDGNVYTDIEKDTIAYIREKLTWTDEADEWFRTEIRKWAAEKGAQ